MESHPILKNKGKAKDLGGGGSPDLGSSSPASSSSSSSPAPSKIPVTFIVKLSDGSPDLSLEYSDATQISPSTLKKEVRFRVEAAKTRKLRLIHGGRILNNEVNIVRDVLKITDRDASIQDRPRIKVYLHCSIGDVLGPGEDDDHDSQAPKRTTLPELRGFDRLRASGFRDEDIAQLRQQFSRLHGGSEPNAVSDEMTRLEEQWIDTGANDATDVTAQLLGGDYTDDLVGVLVGMFLGVFALFFMRESSIFSKRQQKAVVAGVCVNFSFAVIRMLILGDRSYILY